MRHLLFADPGDAHTWDPDDEYLLGDRILVAPVIREGGAISRSLYLPSGAWTNYWTGKVVNGGRIVIVPAPLDQISVFVRAGSILPFIQRETETLPEEGEGNPSQSLTKHLIWRVYSADGPARGTFRLFDGTMAAVSGDGSQTRIAVNDAQLVRNYEVIVPVRSMPKEVFLGGKRLRRIRRGGNRGESDSWQMEPGDPCLHVFVNAADFSLEIRG